VKFTPTAAGTRTGALTLTDNAPNSPQTTSLTGTGSASAVAPTITTQPTSQTVTVGQTATFTVAATGTAPLSYQWRKNGSAISGATSSSYTTPATTSSDNGAQFTVAVSNSAGSTTSNAATLTVTTSTPTPQFGHVAIVVEENTNYASVVGTTAMPYLNGLINQYGLGTQYYANTHPSIGNYFMLTTGQILTNDDSQTPSSFPVSADNIAREVELAGKTWKDYREQTGTYYVRHDPLAYMTNINTANLVSFPQFATDLANGTLPNFSWIAPNGCDDAHDCPLSTADSWLKTNIDPLVKNATFQKDGLLIIVFDESANDNTDGGGRVAVVLISPAFSHVAYQSTSFYQHESVLRLMLEGLGIKTLPGAAATAPAMWEFFDPPAVTTTPLTISTTSLPAGMDGQGYSAQLNATGGTAPYTWSVASGALPVGLTLSSSGAISGVPGAAGTSTFSAKVTDVNLLTAQQSFSITTSASSVCAATGSGVCYYVSPTGSDSSAGTSTSPFLTIQHAANVVNPGDMVIVRDGTYNNPAISGVGSKLIVMSRGGTASNHVVFTAEHKWGAKIDGLNNTSATGWEFSANYIEVRNFECEGFSDTCMENYNGGSSSGGQFISITGNNIHDVGRYCTTTTTGRDGIFISNDNVTIEGNQIHDIGRGAPGEVLSGVTCVDSVNTLHYQNNDHGIYVDAGFTSANNLTIKNNVFYRNERGWSIQVYPGAVNNLRVLNNTFLCPNPYRNGHITLSAPITNSAIENNISWEPTTGFLSYDNTSGYSNLSVASNLTYQGTVGAGAAPGGIALTGNLDNIDPRIVSAPSCTVDAASLPDAHLQLGSPAIDVGLTLVDVPIDYDGTARPQGIKFDLGAFEYHP
jgi:acid phosphatase